MIVWLAFFLWFFSPQSLSSFSLPFKSSFPFTKNFEWYFSSLQQMWRLILCSQFDDLVACAFSVALCSAHCAMIHVRPCRWRFCVISLLFVIHCSTLSLTTNPRFPFVRATKVCCMSDEMDICSAVSQRALAPLAWVLSSRFIIFIYHANYSGSAECSYKSSKIKNDQAPWRWR